MSGEVVVRVAQPDDVTAIREVQTLAFGGPDEANAVQALQEADAVTLSMVAELEAGVVGHVLFSPVRITTPRGRVAEAIGLAPLAVLPRHQRRGIGSRLVREGLTVLRWRGLGGVVVLGHPDYYPRFGFRAAHDLGLRWEHPCPPEAFMAMELVQGAFPEGGGVVRYRPELGGGAQT